jgi:4-amino-4-deoxy-L-arabinose transferase-like glycosyltransferase
LAHGFRLYRDVWENKPPAIYLLYTAVYRLFGPSLIAVRLTAALAVILIVGLTFALAGHWLRNRQAAVFAAMLSGLLFGVPFLEGTTANAEVFLALFAAAGVWAAIIRGHPFLGGVALGIAILFKAVAGFDAAALAIWLLLYRRTVIPHYAAGLGLVLVAALGLAAWARILPDMLRDALLYAFGYIGHGGGGGVPWLVPAKLLALVTITLLLRRQPFPVLWLTWASAGVLISNRLFGHYYLQAVVPLCVSFCLLAPRLAASRRALLALPLVALLAAGATASVGAVLAHKGRDSILARRLQYYANFVRYVAGSEPYSWYRDQIDDHVTRNIRVAALVRAGPPGRLLVWGNTPWIYPLSGRLPATPYTSALRNPEVPGETAALRRAVEGGVAPQVVVIDPPMPSLGRAARSLSTRYVTERAVANGSIYIRWQVSSGHARQRRTRRADFRLFAGRA